MGTSVKHAVTALLQPLTAEGYEIWNVEYVKEGKEKQLRVFIDKEGGIGLDDCERASRWLSDRLDEHDPIGEAYSLIVSSPGMDRQLFTDAQFARYIGQPVEVSLYKGYAGKKRFTALLGRKTDAALYVTPIDSFTLVPEGAELEIPADFVGKVNLMVII